MKMRNWDALNMKPDEENTAMQSIFINDVLL